MRGMRWLAFGVLPIVLGASAALVNGQSTRPADLAAGKLLVASPDLPDPNFAHTVVLLVEYDDEGVVGLILNRRSKVPVSRVLEEIPSAKSRPDPVYAGGPVGRTDVLALVRSRRAPDEGKRVVGDVFLIASKEGLEKTFAAPTEAGAVRVYMGYAGWTAAQLENELDLGAWYIFQGSAKTVFESDPESLWPRLIRETEMHIVRRGSPGGFRESLAAAVLPPRD